MNLLPKTARVLILAFLLFVGASVSYGVVWYGLFLKQEAIKTVLVNAAQRTVETRESAVLRTLLSDTEADRMSLARFLVRREDTTEFLTLLERIGAYYRLDVSLRVSEEKAEGQAFGRLVFSLEVTGTYEDVTNFLERIETLPYQVSVEKVGIERVSLLESEWRGIIDFHVTQHHES